MKAEAQNAISSLLAMLLKCVFKLKCLNMVGENNELIMPLKSTKCATLHRDITTMVHVL